MPTVERVWREALPQGTGLVAGAGGLSREVSWVVSLKPTPPGFEALKGGEIALVSPRVAGLLEVGLPRLVGSLSQRGVSAIGLVGEAPPAAREQAEGLELPLLELPPQSHLPSLEQRIIRLLHEERLRLYSYEQELSRKLMEAALAGRGVVAIGEKLRELTGKGVGMVDGAFAPRFFLPSPTLPLTSPEAFSWLLPRREEVLGLLRPFPPSPSEPPVAGLALSQELLCLLSPVASPQGVAGYLFLLGPREKEEEGRLAVRRGAVALAVEMARLRAVEETEDRLQADLIESLLTGDFPSSEAALQRGRRLGWELSGSFAALAIACPDEREAVCRGVASAHPPALLHFRGETLVALLPLPQGATPQRLKALGETLLREVKARTGAGTAAGLGRPYPAPQGIRGSYREAEEALALGQRLFGPASLTYFGDLGIYRLLFPLLPTGELEAFFQENLGKLSDYDQKRGGELVKTLEAFLSCPTLAKTAQALHIHRNTLLYRLRRIQEVTGLDLGDGEARLRLHLALKAAQTLRAR